jgi:ribosomal protein L7Ae-like RNA K-turn-binding protein
MDGDDKEIQAGQETEVVITTDVDGSSLVTHFPVEDD